MKSTNSKLGKLVDDVSSCHVIFSDNATVAALARTPSARAPCDLGRVRWSASRRCRASGFGSSRWRRGGARAWCRRPPLSNRRSHAVARARWRAAPRRRRSRAPARLPAPADRPSRRSRPRVSTPRPTSRTSPWTRGASPAAPPSALVSPASSPSSSRRVSSPTSSTSGSSVDPPRAAARVQLWRAISPRLRLRHHPRRHRRQD